jgi:hypothetical protein
VALALRCDRVLALRREEELLHPAKDCEEDEKDLEVVALAAAQGRGRGKELGRGLVGGARSRLFHCCIGAYFVSLCGAVAASQLSQHAQPALLYLVPAILATFALAAWRDGVLGEVWAGPAKIEQAL